MHMPKPNPRKGNKIYLLSLKPVKALVCTDLAQFVSLSVEYFQQISLYKCKKHKPKTVSTVNITQ